MNVIENCSSLIEPTNEFKSYEIVIVSNVIKNENNYNYTKTIYNPLEYEEYKFNSLKEKEEQINESNEIITNLQNMNSIYGSTLDSLMFDILPNLVTTETSNNSTTSSN